MIRLKIITKVTFFFLLSFSFFLVSCSNSTEVPKGSLSGTVTLEGETDHSEITIALYNLATLDPDIVSINQQYPHIGVIISQHTEFDHRLQEPVKYTETDAEGYFEIKKIPTGIYNIVALKDSFGFKYIYEFEIEEGENEISQARCLQSSAGHSGEPFVKLSTGIIEGRSEISGIPNTKHLVPSTQQNRNSDLTLYPETTYTDQVPTTTFLTDHHYIIDNPYGEVILYNNSLTIEPGAVVRITPHTDFVIHGTLYAQGEDNNMFWVTSNDGFSVFRFPFSVSRDEVAIYNSMILSEWASVSNDLIEWGKFDFANTCLLNKVNNLHMQNGIFRNGNCGFFSTNVDSTFCGKLFLMNCYGESEGGIHYLNVNNGIIKESILCYNCNGLKIKDGFMGEIKNNYFILNYYGGTFYYFIGSFVNNELINNIESDILLFGNPSNNGSSVIFSYNNFYSNIGIIQRPLDSYKYNPYIYINYNNFFCYLFFIKYNSQYMTNDIDATFNYFNGLENEEEIYEKIIDTSGYYLVNVIIDGYVIIQFNNAGIN